MAFSFVDHFDGDIIVLMENTAAVVRAIMINKNIHLFLSICPVKSVRSYTIWLYYNSPKGCQTV